MKHPLSRWVVSTALSFHPLSPSPQPSQALRFILDPIVQQFEEQQFREQPSDVLQTARRLLILEARFKLRIADTDGCNLDGTALSTDFTLWESMDSPNDLAILYTESASRLFSQPSPEDVLQDGPFMKAIRKDRSDLSDDVRAYLATGGHTDYLMKLAEVCLIQSIIPISLTSSRISLPWGMYILQPL